MKLKHKESDLNLGETVLVTKTATVIQGNTIEKKRRDWKSQLDRVKRNYDRAKKACYGQIDINGCGRLVHEQSCLDQIYNFFMNCYHLKDWLKKDNSFSGIEEFIDKHRELQLCADICNAHKHFELTYKRLGDDKNHEVKEKNEFTKIEGGKMRKKITYFVNIVNTETDETLARYEALDLAKKCIELWEEFIKKYGHTH